MVNKRKNSFWYNNSLSIAFLLLAVFTNAAQVMFESFQNWQSEFLSVFAIIFLSFFLREIGSSQSKPVDAPHSETGE